MTLQRWAIASVLLACLGGSALGNDKRTFILATGRRDPRMYAIDLATAPGRRR
jgi:hypothetical protein